jgi:hypothetical protein
MLRLTIFLQLSLCMCCIGTAQTYAGIDEKARNTPEPYAQSAHALSKYLCEGLQTDEEKTRAFYAWMTTHIAYADSTDGNDIWATPEDIRRQRPENVLRNKTAVCQGYANLFQVLCTEAGIESHVITGICKQPDGRIPRIGHAWNAAKVSGKWQLFDITWATPRPGSGQRAPDDRYFMAEPKTFVLGHLPDDPLWQFLEAPVGERRFRDDSAADMAQYLEKPSKGNFAWSDTLQMWQSMDSVLRLESSAKRMLRLNPDNERIVFELGRHYYLRFFETYFSLDSLVDALILSPGAAVDSAYFNREIKRIDDFSTRGTRYFDQVSSVERRSKIKGYYSRQDIDLLLLRLTGDLYTALQGNLNQQIEKEGSVEDLSLLLYYTNKAIQKYDQVSRDMNCREQADLCQTVLHNRSLVRLETANRIVNFLGQNAEKQAKNYKTRVKMQKFTASARSLLYGALEDVKTMKQQKIVFDYVNQRQEVATEGLVTLRMFDMRLSRIGLVSEVEAVFANKETPVSVADNTLSDLKQVHRQLDNLFDSVTNKRITLGDEYRTQMTRFLLLDIFAQQYNMANLEYRICVRSYNDAIREPQGLSPHKQALRQRAKSAQSNLKNAQKTLDLLESQVERDLIKQRRDMVAQIDQAVVQLLQNL